MNFRNLIISAVLIGGVFCPNSSKSDSTIIPNVVVTTDSLSEWQVFIMALVEVECERNPKAVSTKNAVGPFQITKVYVEEINRLYNTSFTIDDAFEFKHAYKMFTLMNDYYNPTKDIDKAIKLHNPGAGSWYNNKIKKRMDLIRFNEEVRREITL